MENPAPTGSNPNSGPTQGKGATPPAVSLVPNVVAARVYTSAEEPPPERPWYKRAADESGRVLENTWEGLKQSLQTLWEALPYTADEEATEAARGRIADGAMGTLEGIAGLMGSPSGMIMPPELAQAMLDRQQQASEAIINTIKESWNEAEERSGTVGAVVMVATTLATEVAGSKGTGAVASDAQRAAQVAKDLYRATGGISAYKAHWDAPFYHEPDPFCGGQPSGTLFIEQIPHVPRSPALPYQNLAYSELVNMI